MQLANTPPLQSTTAGLHPVSIHQTSPLMRGSKHPITAYYSIYRPRKDERLSRPAWLVIYRNKVPSPGVEPGHVTHPSTNRARRRVTSLIRPTLLPLRHAVTLGFQFSLRPYTYKESIPESSAPILNLTMGGQLAMSPCFASMPGAWIRLVCSFHIIYSCGSVIRRCRTSTTASLFRYPNRETSIRWVRMLR